MFKAYGPKDVVWMSRVAELMREHEARPDGGVYVDGVNKEEAEEDRSQKEDQENGPEARGKETAPAPVFQLNPKEVRNFLDKHAASVRPELQRMNPGLRPSPWDKKNK